MGEIGGFPSAGSQLSASLTTPRTSQTTWGPLRPSRTARRPLGRSEAHQPPPTINLCLGIPNHLSGTLKTNDPMTPKTPWASLSAPRPATPSRDPQIYCKDSLSASRAPEPLRESPKPSQGPPSFPRRARRRRFPPAPAPASHWPWRPPVRALNQSAPELGALGRNRTRARAMERVRPEGSGRCRGDGLGGSRRGIWGVREDPA